MTHEPVLLPLCYLPPIPWFSAYINGGATYLERQEHYTKGTYRNRCLIASANGVHLLTIPLRKGKHQQQAIAAVRIAYDEPWQLRHWRAICSAYGNSPFFEHYADKLAGFYRDKNYETLWDWNFDLLQVVFQLLKIGKAVNLTEAFEPMPTGKMDLRQAFDTNHGFSGYEWAVAVKYPQVFEDRLGFIANLSILDLLFCMGRWPVNL